MWQQRESNCREGKWDANEMKYSMSAEVKVLKYVSVYLCVCRGIWQKRWSTPIGDSALPSWSGRLWHAFKRAVPTKRPIQSNFPCFSSPLNPRGTWLLNPAKSNESQETTSVIASRLSPRNVKHLYNTDFGGHITEAFYWKDDSGHSLHLYVNLSNTTIWP